ncbi:hypothetical protein JCM3765_005710 [Sporobolomyces pararoseus]
MSVRATSTKLPRLLSLLPKDGVGSLVYQSRWRAKQLPIPSPTDTLSTASKDSCFYEIKKVHFKANESGKLKAEAFGVFYWKGKRVTPGNQEFEKLGGGSKHLWQAANPPLALRRQAEQKSTTPPPPAVTPEQE